MVTTPSSMIFTEGGIKNAAPGFIVAKTGLINAATNGFGAEAPLFGLRIPPYVAPNGQSYNRPVAISALRFKLMYGAALATPQGVSLELHKTTTTANYTTEGGGAPLTVLAQRKKFSGYLPIPESEIDIKISAAAPLSGGSQVQQETDAPFEMAGDFSPASFEALWYSEDGFPLVLEQNEGLILHNVDAIPMAAGSFRVFIGIDFFRF